MASQQQKREKPGEGCGHHKLITCQGRGDARQLEEEPASTFHFLGSCWSNTVERRQEKQDVCEVGSMEAKWRRWKESSSQLPIDFSASLLIWEQTFPAKQVGRGEFIRGDFIRTHCMRWPAVTAGHRCTVTSSQKGSYSRERSSFFDGVELGLILIASSSQES